jgi:hypothetical protein
VRFSAQFKRVGGLATLQSKPTAKLDTAKSAAGRGAGADGGAASRGVMVAQVKKLPLFQKYQYSSMQSLVWLNINLS